LGAGAARAAGLPDLKGLESEVLNRLGPKDQPAIGALFESKNLEGTLSYLRRLSDILSPKDELVGISGAAAGRLQQELTSAIVATLVDSKTESEPFDRLAVWLAGGYYERAIEVFTVNYDLLIERALDVAGVPYFDGFVGNLEARFQTDMVDQWPSVSESLPSEFVRLWKVHGSVNWAERRDGDVVEIIRLGAPVDGDLPAAIYPSDEKYDQSRRAPFVVLMDRFRRALTVPETVTLVAGYSFGDQHLNELLFDGARRYPRSELVVLCYDGPPEILVQRASQIPNIAVLAREEGIIGGVRAPWAESEEGIPDVFGNRQCLLGDFSNFARFMTRTRAGHALN